MINALPPRPPRITSDTFMAIGREYNGLMGVVAHVNGPRTSAWIPAVGVVENDRITAHSISPDLTLLSLGEAMQRAEHEAARVGKLVESWVRK